MTIKIDLEQLKIEIRSMNRQQLLYKVLKSELTTLGYWKNKQRGNPKKGYEQARR